MSMWSWFDKAFDIGAAYTEASAPLRLVKPLAAPSRDEFAAWRDDPTTQFVMRALQRNADEYREEWLRKSWGGGQADQRTLDGLRERADALLGFTADYEAFCETLNIEPEQEEQAA
jgi:hypothetical protein